MRQSLAAHSDQTSGMMPLPTWRACSLRSSAKMAGSQQWPLRFAFQLNFHWFDKTSANQQSMTCKKPVQTCSKRPHNPAKQSANHLLSTKRHPAHCSTITQEPGWDKAAAQMCQVQCIWPSKIMCTILTEGGTQSSTSCTEARLLIALLITAQLSGKTSMPGMYCSNSSVPCRSFR